MDRFIINYNGNKYQETKKYLTEFIEKSNYTYIAEPFGGIFGFSRYYYLLKKDNSKLKFLINDLDNDLIEFYTDLKKDFDGTLDRLKLKFEDIIKDMKIDAELTDYLKKNKEDTKLIQMMSKSVSSCFSITKFITKFDNFLKKKKEYIDMLNRTAFYNLEANEFINKHKHKKNILFYFDPPYFNSNNKEYTVCDKEGYYDGTTIYIEILKHFKTSKASNLFILNKIDVINYIFKDYIYSEYTGVYGNKGKTKKHHIIYSSNIKF